MRRAGAGEGPTGRDGRPPFGPPGLGTLCSAAPATPPPHLGARGGPGWGWRPQSPAVPPLALTYLCRGARRKGGGQGTAGLDAHSPGAGQQQFPELPLTRVPGLRWHMATRPRTRGWPCTHRQSPGFAVALGQEGPLPPCPRQPLGPCRSGHRHAPSGRAMGEHGPGRTRTPPQGTLVAVWSARAAAHRGGTRKAVCWQPHPGSAPPRRDPALWLPNPFLKGRPASWHPGPLSSHQPLQGCYPQQTTGRPADAAWTWCHLPS